MGRYDVDYLDEMADRAADRMYRQQWDDERDDIDAARQTYRDVIDDEPVSDR